ncbi:hypothetical protein AADZ91_03170 [Colwelliaceae bacterium 6441]
MTLISFISKDALCYQEQSVKQVETPENTTHSLQEPLKNPLIDDNDYLWMQDIHESISDSVYQSAVWFDNFFLEENTEQASPRVSARIRAGWEPKARDLTKVRTRFRIKVKLPHFKSKVDIILSDDDDANQSNLPLDSAYTQTETDNESFSAALRYTHRKENNRLLESRIGISSGDIFIRSRLKRRHTWDELHSLKFEPSVYYFLDDGLGAKLLLEYDYQLDDTSQFRVNYSIRGSESFTGIRWKHGFYKLKQLKHNSASVLGLKVEGERNGKKGFIIDKYTLSYRYRFNALKRWLFFEVEPFLEWPEQEDYRATPGIALRVEGYFYKG